MYKSGEAYTIDQSLKFEDGRSTYLSKTFASAGNRKAWTFSCWVKRANLVNSEVHILSSGTGNSGWTDLLRFDSSGKLTFVIAVSGTQGARLTTNALLRDTSAWYHIVAVWDSANSTASDRIRLYLNGSRLTSFHNEALPSQNLDSFFINTATAHAIGLTTYSNTGFLDGYLSEVNFIDGQALTPADFGETGTYGEWKPKEYSGTYGTNGFYLPFKQDYTVEGFSTVTYKGNESTMYVGGTGFKPDLVWFKQRDGTRNHTLIDSLRGGTKQLFSNSTGSEETYTTAITSFDTDGFTIGSQYNINEDNKSMVAWNWDMGGTTSTDHTQSNLTSTYRANTTYGQSVVTYTGDGNAGQGFAHGLGASPHFWMIKNRTDSSDWYVYHQSLGNTKALNLNSSAAAATSAAWANYGPVSNAITVNAAGGTNTSGKNYVAYVFEEKTGYSKFGSYTGNGSANHAITGLGFKPAFLIIKRTNSAHEWVVVDNVRNYQGNQTPSSLLANTSAAETNQNGDDVTSLDSDGFTVGVNARTNGNNDNFIYMAFADKREYAYWLDQSGNNNDWTSNNLTESDISVDSPTNNFATLNPLDMDDSITVSEGNLKAIQSGVQHDAIRSTMANSTGKWYFEVRVADVEQYIMLGLLDTEIVVGSNTYQKTGSWYFTTGGSTFHDGTEGNTGLSATAAGDIVQVAYDLDAGKIWWGVNNTWLLSGNPSTGANPAFSDLSGTLAPAGSIYQAANGAIWNFGQDSSFAGNKTAQGNQDSNDIGDFYYTPPTGFLALCTKNLPDVAVVPSEHFNTVLYTGDGGSSNAVTGVGFQPDWLWIKNRTNSNSHSLVDSVRGESAGALISQNTNAEDGIDRLNLDSDGFTLTGNYGFVNTNTDNYVAWNWKANGSGSSNTDGTITSTVSANVDAGFSIISYTGNATANATVGHGLSKAPELVISKVRNYSNHIWSIFVKELGNQNHLAFTTAASHNEWEGHEGTTSLVINLSDNASSNLNHASKNVITYAFHSVDGYSKVGSYTGNGNADGTFVYTGFRPAYVMIKNTDSSGTHWIIWDKNRNGYNDDNAPLYANLSNGEGTGGSVDLTSNGFKLRTTSSIRNESDSNFIYLAFAETPFKYSNAR
jgi:hypothetical protein